MEMIYVRVDQGVPRYVYTGCKNCSSIMGISMCSIKNRGCCYYYPKFTLLEIQRMARSLEGLWVLETIRRLPSVEIHPFEIYARGYFDEEGYIRYMESGNKIDAGSIQDHSIFFKACPFVKSGYGCTLPPRYRTYVCNFFLCDEVIEKIKGNSSFEAYIKERERYVRWVEWENTSLKEILFENKLDLVKDFDGTIKLLQEIPLNIYDFPQLQPIVISAGFSRGA